MSDIPAYVPELVPQQYWDWIAANVPEDCHNLCNSTTEAMAAAFPELERVRGYFHDPAIGARPHWWLVHPDGYIVDPTARQFPSGGIGLYEPYTNDEGEEGEEPIGRCINCGELCYASTPGADHNVCSTACHRACVAEFNANLRSA